MLCGMPCIDVDDWVKNTEFKDGYNSRSKQACYHAEKQQKKKISVGNCTHTHSHFAHRQTL